MLHVQYVTMQNPSIQVEKSADAWEKEGSDLLEADSLQLRPLIGTITSLNGDGGYINQTTYFPRSSLCKGTVSKQASTWQAMISVA